MDVQVNIGRFGSQRLFLLLLISAFSLESPALAEGLYGAGYQFQRTPQQNAADSDRFESTRRRVSPPNCSSTEFASQSDSAATKSPPPPSFTSTSVTMSATQEKDSAVPSGESLHDKDRTVDPWHVDEAKLAAYKKTIETATGRISKEPQSAAPYIDRADAYLHLRMSKESLEDSNKAISLKPDTVQRTSNSYCNKGEAQLQLGKFAEGLEDLNKAISLDEESAEAYYFRGMAQEKLGHLDAALKDYQQARDFGFAPKGVEVDFAEFMYNLQRSIKKEWYPPKGEESRKTVVTFKVYRNGLLDALKLTTPSGLELANEAALNAVRSAAPFQPLPKGAPRVVDIQFSFDYNVIRKADNSEQKIVQLSSAEKDAQEKVDAAEKSGDDSALVNALLVLGDVYRQKGNFHFAENNYNRAKELSEKREIGDFTAGKAIAKLAMVEVDRGKKREAEELFNKSLDLALKAGKAQTDPDTGLVLREYAKLLYKENRFEDVKKMYARFKMI